VPVALESGGGVVWGGADSNGGYILHPLTKAITFTDHDV